MAVEHIYHGAVDRRRGYLPVVRFDLTESPPCAQHSSWGSPHMVGRFIDALAVSAPIVSVPADMEVLSGLRRLLFASLDNPTGFAFDIGPDPDGRRSACMHHCREVLLALAGLATWQKCDESAGRARRFVRDIEVATRATGTFPAGFRLEAGWDELDGSHRYPPMNSGRLIGALLRYYRAIRDPIAIDLAVRLADYNLARAFTPSGDLTEMAGTHLHSIEGTVTGLIDLGRVLGDAEYVEAGRRIYDVGLRPWRTSFGWAAEKRINGPGRGEANNTGDLIQTALLLGQGGHRAYFADAERFIRNGLLASQVVNTDWIADSDGRPDTPETIYSDVRRRARGGFVFTTPSDYHSYATDLVGGAVQSLCDAWNSIVTQDQAGLHVNLLLSRPSEAVTVRSHLPVEGRVEATMHRPGPLFIRAPHWLSRESLRLRINDQEQPARPLHHETFVANLTGGDRVELTFAQPQQRVAEKAAGHPEPFSVEWLGDTVTNINPQGRVVRLY